MPEINWMPDKTPPLPDGEKKDINDREKDKDKPIPEQPTVDVPPPAPDTGDAPDKDEDKKKRGPTTINIAGGDDTPDARDQFGVDNFTTNI